MGIRNAAAKGIALAGVALAMSPGSAAAHQAIFGYNDRALYGSGNSKVTSLLHATGAQAYRMTLEWHGIEPRPGVWQWSEFDRRYKQILAAGLRPVMMLRSAPQWAQQDRFSSCAGAILVGGCVRPPAPSALGNWAEFARRAAERYPKALGFEIWNEPNHPAEWTPSVDPVYYARVLRVAHDAIKRERREAIVVSGGIAPLDAAGTPGSVDPDRFLRIFYGAGGRGAMDAIGIHPYGYPGSPLGADSYYNQVMSRLRTERDLAGDSKTPFWITEFGYHTGAARFGGLPPETQAAYLAQAVPQVIAEPDVDVALLHSLVDWGDDRFVPGYSFGLLDTKLIAKPALAAVERVVPPAIDVLSAPKTIRSTCPKPRKAARKAAKCRTGGSVKVQLWKASTVTVSITGARRRAFRASRTIQRGDGVVKVSARVRRKPMRPGRYKLTIRAVDRFGNASDPLQRKIRIR